MFLGSTALWMMDDGCMFVQASTLDCHRTRRGATAVVQLGQEHHDLSLNPSIRAVIIHP